MKNEALCEELNALVTEKGGLLKGADVVRYAAAHRDSEIGKHVFRDNDKTAALKYRLDEARKLIRSYVIFLPQVNREVRALISVPSDRTVLGAYRPVADVVASPRYRGELVNEALKRVASIRNAYKYLPELDVLFDRIDAEIARFNEGMHQRGQAG